MSAYKVNPLEKILKVAFAALEIGELDEVYEAVREGLKLDPGCGRLLQAQALALSQDGRWSEALELVSKLDEEASSAGLSGDQKRELWGACGRVYKDQWRRSGSEADLSAAIGYYHRAFEEGDGDVFPLINEATLRMFADEQEVAEKLAGKVKKLTNGRRDFWSVGSHAEACLLLGELEQACEHYRVAVEECRPAPSWREAARMREQARWVCGLLGEGTGAVDAAFASLPKVLVYAGHRIDQSDAASVSRFPPGREDEVREKLKTALTRLRPAITYGSAASGADLLFLEECPEEVERHLVFPGPLENFLETSVAGGGERWVERFWKEVARADDEPLVLNAHAPSGSSAVYDYGNHVVLGLAKARARRLGLEVHGLVVWDGEEGSVGGTGGFVAACEKAGVPVEVVGLPASSSASLESGEGMQEVHTILMADLMGFGALAERQVAAFHRHYLGLVAKLIGAMARPPLEVNTWGDALHLVFETLEDGVMFALDLQDATDRFDACAVGLPGPLEMRVALHAGPVFPVKDPITGRAAYTGNHVTRAARMEPLTRPGQISASEALAALLELSPVEGVRAFYVGKRRSEKAMLELPMYRLERVS